MTQHTRVAVIGGGIMGASVLYHLAREGWTDCALFEKAELTSGATWHAAGQITHAISNYTLAKIGGYGVELYQQLEEETGQSVTFHACGSLRLAYDDGEMDWNRHILSIGRGLGHPMEIIGPDEIAKLQPFYKLDGVKAALHTPADGHLDPAGGCFALAKGARMRGAKIIRQTLVTDIRRERSGEWRVVTDQGDWLAEHVVNAGGYYARQLGQMVGLDLPIVNVLHQYLVTEPMPELAGREAELPVIRDDSVVSGYVRQEQQSILIGVYEKVEPASVWHEGAPWEAEHELFEADFERPGPWLEAAFDRMPAIADIGIRRVVNGAIPETPDGNMLLGPAAGLENFWCACGAQVGIAWGPGAGKYLAQWMVHGAADISLRSLDPRRYGGWAGGDYLVPKVHEAYLMRHEVPFPNRNRMAARPNRTSPLYDRLKDAGAVFEEIYGLERPRWFAREGVAREEAMSFRRSTWFDAVAHETDGVRNRVGVMDLTAFGKMDVTGPDAAAFLDRMVANRVPRKDGGIVLSHILNERGTIEAEVTIARLDGERFYLAYAAFMDIRVRDWLVQHKRDDENAIVSPVSDDYGCLVLSGPESRNVLRQLTQRSLENDAFKWLTVQEIPVAGTVVRALRVSYVGELGWELHVPMADMEKVYDAIWQAGQDFGIVNFGSAALNAMRMEKGFKGAHELTPEVTLPEADVMRFAKLDKDDFIGKAETEASLAGDLPWKCAYLAVDANGVDCIGSETVFHNGEPVGHVSSAGYGHAVKQSLAFAYVKPAAAEPGAELELMILGERHPARVLADPVYDPASERPRM